VAAGVISELTARGALPIVTGGTGLYIRALLNGIVETEQVSSEVVASLDSFLREREEHGGSHAEAVAALHGWLQQEDPESAAKLAVSDLARIRRALAVKLSLGRSLASLQGEHQLAERPYRALVVCCLPEREWLYQRIDSRCEEMLRGGLLDEVRELLSRYPAGAKPLSAIGYRHARLYLDGALSYEEMVQLFQRDTRRFAKRQYTWWRHQPRHLGWREVAEGYLSGGGGPGQAIADFLYRKGEFSPDFSTESVAFLPVQTVEWGAALASV
jgi:tRNA dimethylallyltransferase